MEAQTRKFSGNRIIFSLAGFIVIVAGLKAAKEILLPVTFALFFAFLGSAIVELLEKRIPRGLAVVGVAMSLFCITGLLVYGFAKSLESFLVEFPTYYQKIEVQLSALESQYADKFGLQNSSASEADSSPDISQFEELAKKAFAGFSSFMVVMITLCFMLMETRLIKAKLSSAFGDRIRIDRFEQVSDDVQRYLLIKSMTSAATGVSIGLLTWAFGVPFFVLWGILAFFLNYIPVVGSFVAAVPALVLVAAEDGMGMFLAVGTGYFVINNLISNVLEPIFLGKGLGISPLIVFISLLFWGWVWGPAGMLISIPLAMLLKIIFEHSEDFHWVSVLMSDKVPEE